MRTQSYARTRASSSVRGLHADSHAAVYGDVELSGLEDDWTLGTAVRIEHFDDFGTTMDSKLSGRFGFVRASVSIDPEVVGGEAELSAVEHHAGRRCS